MLGRNYVGIEISRQYVEKASRRLTELKKKRGGNLFFKADELEEVQRLSRDIGRTPAEIVADKTLLKYFANQFAVRTDNRKRYSVKEMTTALEGLAG